MTTMLTQRSTIFPRTTSERPISFDPRLPELRTGVNGALECKNSALQSTRAEHPEWVAVTPVRCFPWSEATRFVSLRDANNRELALIEQVHDLAPTGRQAMLDALRIAGFLLEVTSVVSVEEDFEIRAWKVVTACGPRSFQTERDNWPQSAPGGGHMIQDVAGDVFFIPPIGTLDARSQKLLWPYVD
jgi:hypothetical protein